jgi:hypothetical protein
MAWTSIDFGVTATTYDQAGPLRLGERDYTYRLIYTTRSERWTISLYTVSEVPVPLIEGRPLCLGVDVLARCNVVGRPPGALFLWRNDSTLDPLPDPHLGLGTTARVWYTDPE